jgi:hypothetical protein
MSLNVFTSLFLSSYKGQKKNKRTGIYLLTFLPEFATVYLSGGSHDKAKKQLCFP